MTADRRHNRWDGLDKRSHPAGRDGNDPERVVDGQAPREEDIEDG